MKDKIYAIVLAAGSGKRMQSDIPKQYLLLNNETVLSYSLKCFDQSEVDGIVLVVGKGEIEFCKGLVDTYGIKKPISYVEGGKERYDSVYEGLKVIRDATYCLIHDGARPLIQKELIHRLIEEVKNSKACIPAIPVKDTIKQADEQMNVTKTIQRQGLYAVQTPQAFSYQVLMDAYRCFLIDKDENKKTITDDAMLVERYSDAIIRIIPGDYANIKITTPEDIMMAEFLLKENNIRK